MTKIQKPTKPKVKIDVGSKGNGLAASIAFCISGSAPTKYIALSGIISANLIKLVHIKA